MDSLTPPELCGHFQIRKHINLSIIYDVNMALVALCVT